MNVKILKLIEKDARMSVDDIATVCGIDRAEAERELAEMERDGLIRGYKGVIDWEKVDRAAVSAIIELKVTPTAGLGFEEVAAKVSKYPQVESVYLMSGGYDLNVVVKGKTLQEVARFVARELATIDSVTNTTTHFVMRRYKEMDVKFCDVESDDRGKIII